jgi:hypothetical protein
MKHRTPQHTQEALQAAMTTDQIQALHIADVTGESPVKKCSNLNDFLRMDSACRALRELGLIQGPELTGEGERLLAAICQRIHLRYLDAIQMCEACNNIMELYDVTGWAREGEGIILASDEDIGLLDTASKMARDRIKRDGDKGLGTWWWWE